MEAAFEEEESKARGAAWYAEKGLRFECQRCSACCRGEPGYVFLTSADISALSAFFSQTRKAFLAEYCRVVDLGSARLYSLRETADFDCALWDGGCSAYAARPVQCRSYPFWERIIRDAESWQEECSRCPGIGRGPGLDAAEIGERLALRHAGPPEGPAR
jgi:uncharacterized protein